MLESHYPITSLADALTRLVVATVLGAVVGLNRELRHKPAGLRTHALVSLGSALTTVVMVELVTASGTNGIDSISRVVQGIVAGVGFIGGGVILRRLHEGEVQGLTTVVLVVFADHLTSWFHIGYVQTGIFRITLFGALLLVMFLSALTVLFYLDDRRGALWCSLVFLLGNATLSIVTLRENEAWYGFGFVVAAGLALLLAASRVNHHLEHLEYRTFCVLNRS